MSQIKDNPYFSRGKYYSEVIPYRQINEVQRMFLARRDLQQIFQTCMRILIHTYDLPFWILSRDTKGGERQVKLRIVKLM